MPVTAVVEVEGHIIDSLILAKILDVIVEAGAEHRIVDMQVGKGHTDPSKARIEVSAANDDALAALLTELHMHGAHPIHEPDAVVQPADRDGVLPSGFYSTTNLPTVVKYDGHWYDVVNPEMDCGLVVDVDAGTARTVPMHRVRVGDLVVIGSDGVRVQPLEKPRGHSPFEFMISDVSSEKPKALLVAEVASRIRQAKERGGRLLAVCGPAVVHTGAAPDVAALVRAGWIDVLFAGNGFATHDIESNLLGTSLGVSVTLGNAMEGGHANHLRVINEVRSAGSIAAVVDSGRLRGGVMYECVKRGVPFVLAGSIRDDGPLPDVIPNVVDAVDAMRAKLDGVRVALMLASTLHAIATGNILPAGVETYCVDINQAVVTKLADRGSHQALGLVTDVGLFLRDLVEQLVGVHA
jgi:lysine-ketoglutarate reductase/saccharopine dehydrogenase-like protein (TIGR00300 family)